MQSVLRSGVKNSQSQATTLGVYQHVFPTSDTHKAGNGIIRKIAQCHLECVNAPPAPSAQAGPVALEALSAGEAQREVARQGQQTDPWKKRKSPGSTMSAIAEITEEELLEAYEDVIKKGAILRYLKQTEHGIVEEPLQNSLALVPRAYRAVLKRQKVCTTGCSLAALGREVPNVTDIVFLTWLRSSLNVCRVCCGLHAVLSPLPWKILCVVRVFLADWHPLLFLGLLLAGPIHRSSRHRRNRCRGPHHSMLL